ncbi:MAG: ComEA family DNA-binding protein [Candidatus Dojkabacteria bacterium]|nr:ComEA family DNA-binding protein [Candidatus Dojkabacteria bacterium]MDQ7021772.1 ComEA family DNA-binding protein [Candidatus Dojkabacteria bacterium]
MINIKQINIDKIKMFIAFCLLISALLGFAYSSYLSLEENGKLEFTKEIPEEGYIFKKVAYISGEVNTPGVYEITDHTRIYELVEYAGGFNLNADTQYINKELNLATLVNDEEHVFIPSKEQYQTKKVSLIPETYNKGSDLININTSTLEDLDTLPGIGKSTAEKIIDNRPYSNINDLLDISGIGDSKFNEISNLISI